MKVCVRATEKRANSERVSESFGCLLAINLSWDAAPTATSVTETLFSNVGMLL